MKPLYIIILILWVGAIKGQCQQAPCIFSSFRKVFFKQGDTIRILHQVKTSDGGQLLVGQFITGGSNHADGLLLKLDTSANIIWSKRISSTLPQESLILNNAIESANGGYLIAGFSKGQSGNQDFSYCLFKYDTSGNALWQQQYPINSSAGQWYNAALTGLMEGENGSIYISGTLHGEIPQQNGTQFPLLLKTDSAGNMKFDKLFYEDNVDLNTFIGVFPTNGKLLVWGYSDDNHNSQTDTRRIYRMHLDTMDGSFLNGQAFCFTPFSSSAIGYTFGSYFFKAFKTNNGYAVAGLLAESGATNRALGMLHFDNNLQLIKSWMLPKISGIVKANHGDFFVAADGSMLLAQRGGAAGAQTYLTRFDTDGVRISQRQVDGFGPGTGVNIVDGGMRIEMSENNIRFTSNYLHNLTPSAELLQLAPNTNEPVCFGTETSFGSPQTFSTYSMPATNFNWLDDIVSSQTAVFTTSDIIIETESKCSVQSICNELKLTGQDTVCILGQPILYTVRRNESCSLPVRWVFDNAHCANAIILSDSTISITWRVTMASRQTTRLIALTDACTGLSDTLNVFLVPFLKPFKTDTLLCNGDSIRLSPGNWFRSYRWQDGSTDSVLVARKPGWYKVVFESFCGPTYTDSIEIKGISAALIQNRMEQICTGNSVTLQANAGFTNYQWTPDYFMINRTETSVIVTPPMDTIYVVSANTESGCRIRDSVRIETHLPTDIQIVQKPQNCEVILTAQSTATLYEALWSGPISGTGMQIEATQSGQYSFVARDENNCLVKDIIKVTLPDCISQIDFPNAFSPNHDGRNDIFRPVIKGPLMNYELSIFNIWGQRVFYSREPSSGWDGTLSGKPQQQATFVWVCRYQVAGRPSSTKKGTVVLVR